MSTHSETLGMKFKSSFCSNLSILESKKAYARISSMVTCSSRKRNISKASTRYLRRQSMKPRDHEVRHQHADKPSSS